MRRWLVVLALTGCGHWTKKDTALELAFVAATVADWSQTVTITDRCNESNPIMGKCGDVMPANAYFPVAILAHAAIAACLPHPWRTVFQAFSTGLEVGTVLANERMGYDVL